MTSPATEYQQMLMSDRVAYATILADAGNLIPKGLRDPDTGKPVPGKILLVMDTGSMLDLHPMAAIQGIDIVDNKLTLSAKLQKALINTAGHRIEIVKEGSIPGGDYKVMVVGTRADNGEVHSSTWDIPRAIRAGLVDSYIQNDKGEWEVRARDESGRMLPWESSAENLPVWRSIADVAREGFPDVLLGLYSTEEIRDGIPTYSKESGAVEAPARDWLREIKDASTVEELATIKLDLADSRQGTDVIRNAYLGKLGQLERAVATRAEARGAEPVDREADAEGPATTEETVGD